MVVKAFFKVDLLVGEKVASAALALGITVSLTFRFTRITFMTILVARLLIILRLVHLQVFA